MVLLQYASSIETLVRYPLRFPRSIDNNRKRTHCKPTNLRIDCCVKMSWNRKNEESKVVWIWTENKQVMTAAVERGWNTFVFDFNHRQIAKDWSSIALINPLYIKDQDLTDDESRRVASYFEISSPQQLYLLLLSDGLENAIIDLLDWQVIPAENIVAAFQGSNKPVFAVAKTPSQAQLFLEALEQGLGGVVLKVDDVAAVLELKDYFDRRNEENNNLTLVKATVDQVLMAGMGDRVCVDLCSLMRPGEGLLVRSHVF